jgi:hypothetical protein
MSASEAPTRGHVFSSIEPSSSAGTGNGPQYDGRQAERNEGHRDESRPRIKLDKLREAKLKDYAIRFVFGGAISVLAVLIAHWTTERFGGVFTAFPAILLASLTLIGQRDGREPSSEDAAGGVAGALALMLTAVFLAATLDRLPGALSLVAALGLWLLVAVALYGLAVRLGWLRTVTETNDSEQGKRDGA